MKRKALILYAGREDCDVRMLGTGRPFVMEVQNMRAAIPEAAFFSRVEEKLREVTPSTHSIPAIITQPSFFSGSQANPPMLDTQAREMDLL